MLGEKDNRQVTREGEEQKRSKQLLPRSRLLKVAEEVVTSARKSHSDRDSINYCTGMSTQTNPKTLLVSGSFRYTPTNDDDSITRWRYNYLSGDTQVCATAGLRKILWILYYCSYNTINKLKNTKIDCCGGGGGVGGYDPIQYYIAVASPWTTMPHSSRRTI